MTWCMDGFLVSKSYLLFLTEFHNVSSWTQTNISEPRMTPVVPHFGLITQVLFLLLDSRYLITIRADSVEPSTLAFVVLASSLLDKTFNLHVAASEVSNYIRAEKCFVNDATVLCSSWYRAHRLHNERFVVLAPLFKHVDSWVKVADNARVATTSHGLERGLRLELWI